MNDLTITSVPTTLIDYIWDEVEEMLERVIKKAPDDLVSEVIKERLKAGENMLMIIYRDTELVAALVLDVRTLDSGVRYLSIPVIAGSEMDEWAEDFLDIARAIAKDYNCTELRGMAARPGWLRYLKSKGWEECFTTVRCYIGE